MVQPSTPPQHDIVITGRGVVSAFGHNISAFEEKIFGAACAIASIEDLNDQLLFKTGAPVRDFDPNQSINPRECRMMDPFSQFAVHGALDALKEAGLSLDEDADDGMDPSRLGVVTGSACGGISTLETQYSRLYLKGSRKVSPMTVPMVMGSGPASHIAKAANARGPVFGVTSACASFNHALNSALSLLKEGAADVVICCGTDANFAHGNLKAWEALHAVSPDTCRPFSIDRKGLSMGEGAGVIVLERLDHALARKAKPLAKVLGVGMSSDAGNLVAPDAQGMYGAMNNALRIADLSPSDIDYINAHGTGTKANDQTESEAVCKLLGKQNDATPLSSTKSQLGHALGASGAFEMLATIGGILRETMPPTVNFTQADPECPVNVIANTAHPAKINIALSNSFAFGGLNASAVIQKA
ncbi:beta-ketoacyl-[acyl-carrier-protein] synthase family protein [Terasakiella pusilla]|uniref:beta-ketoacyl-[acyl-carrier-protein] synthase family protein n=1 Tax=Terasakiella pusilla TaxID=64973 RepID=UPI003AA7F71C